MQPDRRKGLSCFRSSLVVAAAVFAVILILDRDRYLRHERWTEFQLLRHDPRVGNPLPMDPTAGGEFVTAWLGLALNPKIAPRVELQLSEAEKVALRSEARRPFFWKSQPEDWLTRVCSVIRKDDRISVRVYLTDANLAERVGRVVADQVIQFAIRLRIDEQMMEDQRLFREVERLGDKAPPEMKQKLREASMGTGMQMFHMRMADRFYPKASDGKIIVWWRLGEAAAQAMVGALVCGTLAWALAVKFGKRAPLSP